MKHTKSDGWKTEAPIVEKRRPGRPRKTENGPAVLPPPRQVEPAVNFCPNCGCRIASLWNKTQP